MALVFVGAGGSGVSALVQLMYDLRIPDIIALDAYHSSTMQRFKDQGIVTHIGHDSYLPQPKDLLIYSAATRSTPQVQEAFRFAEQDPLCLPPMLYAEFLGELSKYFFTIAIAGTHGKSTTTGMTAKAAIQHLPQTILAIVGAGVTERNGINCRYDSKQHRELHELILHIISRKQHPLPFVPKSKIFIIEADEFNRHFLFLDPDISVVTSLGHDHVDIYPTRESYLETFTQFLQNTKQKIILPTEARSQLDYLENFVTPEQQSLTFTHLIGGHNHSNATLACEAIYQTGLYFQSTLDKTQILTTIADFQGLFRRAELLGYTPKNIPVYSDYGHHPDEIKSTLHAFREKFPIQQITCFFEPHQARRLLSFWDEFISAFEGTQLVVVPAYTAREHLPDIQNFLKTLPSTDSRPKSITSIDELSSLFSEASGALLVNSRDGLSASLQHISTGVIVCFSAGILDEKVRKIV